MHRFSMNGINVRSKCLSKSEKCLCITQYKSNGAVREHCSNQLLILRSNGNSDIASRMRDTIITPNDSPYLKPMKEPIFSPT